MSDELIEKKEVQAQIMPTIVDASHHKATKEEIINILKQVIPGTQIRSALNGIVQAKKGALIIIDKTGLDNIMDGGFKVNCKLTPQRLVELSKMDGAIVLSDDLKRITHANVTIYPDTKISTNTLLTCSYLCLISSRVRCVHSDVYVHLSHYLYC